MQAVVRVLVLVLAFGCWLASSSTATAHELAAPASADQDRDDDRDRDARADATLLTDELRSALQGPKKSPAIQAAYTGQAERRRRAMTYLAERNPRLFLNLALSSVERTALPPEIRSNVEQHASAEGDLQVLHFDGDDGHTEYDVSLHRDGQRIPIRIGTSLGQAQPGDRVQVVGVVPAGDDTIVTNQIVVGQGTGTVGTTGNQRTAVILVKTPSGQDHAYTNTANTASIIFSSTSGQSLRAFYLEASYNQTTVVGRTGAEGTAADVYGPISISNAACGQGASAFAIANEAISAADPLINYSEYDRVILSIRNPACTFNIGTVRQAGFTTTDSPSFQRLSIAWIFNDRLGSTALNGKVGNSVLHEYGHNIGFYHSNALECGKTSLGSGSCSSIEYGDPSDVMNLGGDGHPNSVHKDIVEWLTGRVQDVTTNGSYTVNAYENGTLNTKVLRIPRTRDANGDVNAHYYLEYRKPGVVWNGYLAGRPEYGNGVLVHTSGWTPFCASACGPDFQGSGGGGETHLIDTLPASQGGAADLNDAPLAAGESYTDPAAGVTIQITSAGPTSATVNVTFSAPHRTVHTIVYPEDTGSIIGGGTYNVGQEITLRATPAACFVRWRDNGVSIGSTNPLTFVVAEDRLLEATFTPNCTGAPANDAFAGTAIAAGQQQAVTTGASTESGEPLAFNCGGSSVSVEKTIWYSFTPAVTRQTSITTVGSTYDTVLAIYVGNAVNALDPLSCNDDQGGTDRTSSVHFQAQAGVAYRIQVGGWEGSAGNAVLNVASAVANCNPRPKVTLSQTNLGDGRLQVTVTAGNAAGGNRLNSITFGPDSRVNLPNVLLEVPGVAGQVPPGFTHAIPDSPVSFTFNVKRAGPGSVTLPMTVADSCGTWQTLVGGGTGTSSF